MSLPKQKSREIAFQILYSQNFSIGEEETIIDLMMKITKTSKKNVAMAFDYTKKIKEHIAQIDELIELVCTSYDFNRISKAELNIIRLGVFELLYTEIPAKVVIAEAIRLCRKFGTVDSANFVNALLDAIYKKEEKTDEHKSTVAVQ